MESRVSHYKGGISYGQDRTEVRHQALRVPRRKVFPAKEQYKSHEEECLGQLRLLEETTNRGASQTQIHFSGGWDVQGQGASQPSV